MFLEKVNVSTPNASSTATALFGARAMRAIGGTCRAGANFKLA